MLKIFSFTSTLSKSSNVPFFVYFSYITAPVGSLVVNKWGNRTIVIMGGGLTSFGLFLSFFFASGVLHLIITHGLITGKYVLTDGCPHSVTMKNVSTVFKRMQVCM